MQNIAHFSFTYITNLSLWMWSDLFQWIFYWQRAFSSKRDICENVLVYANCI